jgi:hypothetical protein
MISYLIYYPDGKFYCRASSYEEAMKIGKGFCSIVRFDVIANRTYQMNFPDRNVDSIEFKQFTLDCLLEIEKKYEKKLFNLISRNSKNYDTFKKDVVLPLWEKINTLQKEIKQLQLK